GFLGYLRSEFVHIPIALLLASGFATFARGAGIRQTAVVAVPVVIAVVAVVLLKPSVFLVQESLAAGFESYQMRSAAYSSDDSLGHALVVSQPIYIRIFVGIVYLMVFPIPMWHGFQLESVYQLFKSLHSIFMLF